MQTIDFICLWTGYVVCALALIRCLIESVFATYRTYRRAFRWITRIYGPSIVAFTIFGESTETPEQRAARVVQDRIFH